MEPNPYQRFRDRELSLADFLAIDRTVLANERTALAYGRTVLAMLVVGGTCIKFFESALMRGVGVAFIGAALAVAVIGGVRFWRTRRYLGEALERHTGERTHPLRESVSEQEGAAAPPATPDSTR